ncbi:hypothetical protein OUZ56_024763 [Daphnia magna]|uniref:Uncharacterized protein n=1 Tax=Daphnia magna TaxID=35525 RepID=A0ABQ9ZHY8_9CRUS|nr:hypothetical protein OUZ56_024763 [Daphnia magna]
MATESPRTGLVSLGMSEVHSGRDPTMKPKERNKFEKLTIKTKKVVYKFGILKILMLWFQLAAGQKFVRLWNVDLLPAVNNPSDKA